MVTAVEIAARARKQLRKAPRHVVEKLLARFIHMTTKTATKSKPGGARRFLEDLAGGPLTLGRLMRSIREGEEMSLAEMGRRLGVTRGHVSNIESGKAVSAETAARYAKALGYGERQFVRLALQDQLQRAGLPYEIELTTSGRRKKAG